MTSISTLLSKLQLDRKQTQLTSANVARADIEGYTRKVAYAEKLVLKDAVSGVKQGAVTRVIDTVIQQEVRAQNSSLGKSQVLGNYYKTIEQLMGRRGDESSFSHNLNNFAVKMTRVGSITDNNQKRETIQQAITLCNQLNHISDTINKLRGQSDQDLSEAINDLNTLSASMTEYNKQIVSLSINHTDTTNLEDERDLVIHKSAELTGVQVYLGQMNNQTLALESGDIISTVNASYPLTYTAASYVAPGDVLSPITNFFGANLTGSFANGRISALVELRDTILPDLQAELDELTRVLRDTTNALHNEAAALNGDATLTGLAYAPGVAGVLTGAVTISGQGTLRIGVADRNGTLLDYKDIALTDGMTIAGLIATINGAAYVNSNAAGAFTVTQLATGELQVTSTANNSVVLGASGTVKPSISPTATYDATQAYGLSHFFGLNNLFDTGIQIANSTTPQIGIANSIAVRDKFKVNADNLSVGRLTSVVPAPTGVGLGITANDASVALEIGSTLTTGQLSFLPAGVLDVANIPLTDYSIRIMNIVESDITSTAATLEVTERVFDELAALAQDKSGVDPSEEILRIMELSTSQNLTSKALNIVTTMERDLVMTLTK